ncbi:hypothetical protein ACP70R_034412 [Stipagrostis hirtigluma subsp. patula]
MGNGLAWRRRRRCTLSLVTVAALLENADEALLPAVYREVGASPTALGSITLCRSLVQALCYPLAACAAARYDRSRVVAAGAFLWAAATLLVGASATFLQASTASGWRSSCRRSCRRLQRRRDARLGVRVGVHGGRHGRGHRVLPRRAARAYGLPRRPGLAAGVPRRRAHQRLADRGLDMAVLRRPPAARRHKGTAKVAEELAREAKDVARVPTFWIVVAQGVIISVPWSALNFAAMWLELLGFTHWETTVITSLNSLATSLEALCAGFVGDPVARRFPDTGRAALGQLSNAAIILVAAVLLLALPGHDHPWACASYAAVFFVLGIAINWCPVTTNKWDDA